MALEQSQKHQYELIFSQMDRQTDTEIMTGMWIYMGEYTNLHFSVVP